MQTLEILCIGKIKETYWNEALAEYAKRLGRFCRFKVTELPETRLPEHAGLAEERAVVEDESERLMKAFSKGPDVCIVALAIKGKSLSSEQLAYKLSSLAGEGTSHIVFVIGGSLGLSEKLLAAADLRLSFSAFTFPHQMMRVILAEQLYRVCKINAGEVYHK